jgi:hypothetical protein
MPIIVDYGSSVKSSDTSNSASPVSFNLSDSDISDRNTDLDSALNVESVETNAEFSSTQTIVISTEERAQNRELIDVVMADSVTVSEKVEVIPAGVEAMMAEKVEMIPEKVETVAEKVAVAAVKVEAAPEKADDSEAREKEKLVALDLHLQVNPLIIIILFFLFLNCLTTISGSFARD